MAVGLGIHGEPGIAEDVVPSAAALARLLVDRLIDERPESASGRVAAVLNGLGCTKYEELFGLWTQVEACLDKAGLIVVAPEVGEFVTSLDMAGCSLTLAWLDDELEALWLAPVDAPVLRRGVVAAMPLAPTPDEAEAAGAPGLPEASSAARQGGACVAALLGEIADAMQVAEAELGRLDAIAGDGDHGQAMSRGSAAAAEAARLASRAGGGTAGVLARAGDAWADRAGGTSGALWGLALRSWSEALSDDAAPTPACVSAGARHALEAVTRLGGARLGDKTMVDAFEPFVVTLEAGVGAGRSLPEAWDEAALAAGRGAEGTSALSPRLGRARPLAARSLGHRDAGAVSLARCAEVAGRFIAALAGRDP